MNGMCHLEGGGNTWQMNLNLPDKTPSSSPPTNATSAAVAVAAAAAAAAVSGYQSPPPPTKQPHLDFNHQQHHCYPQQHHTNGTGAEGQSQIPQQMHHQASNPGLPHPPLQHPLLESSHQPQQQQQQQHVSSTAHPILPPSLRESVSF